MGVLEAPLIQRDLQPTLFINDEFVKIRICPSPLISNAVDLRSYSEYSCSLKSPQPPFAKGGSN